MLKHYQAIQKFCPTVGGLCQGDKCMAWRWATVEQLAHATHERIRLDDGVGSDPAELVKDWPNNDQSPEGYCGLAGVPFCAS